MSEKRETPLNNPSLEGHHCTVDLRLEKLRMVPFFQALFYEQLRMEQTGLACYSALFESWIGITETGIH